MPKENKQSIFWFGLDENLRAKIHNKIFERNPTSISADVSKPLLQTNCSLKDLMLCLQEIVLEQESPNTETLAPNAKQIEMLTLAEKRILYQTAQLKTETQIADYLCLSLHTVRTHTANIRQKLQLKGRHTLRAFALQMCNYLKNNTNISSNSANGEGGRYIPLSKNTTNVLLKIPHLWYC